MHVEFHTVATKHEIPGAKNRRKTSMDVHDRKVVYSWAVDGLQPILQSL